MQFDLMRLSLLERLHGDLFADRVAFLPTREVWLRRVLAREVVFIHRKDTFHFVPEPPDGGAAPAFPIGRIGRAVSVQENQPPEAGLKETKRETWRASLVMIDPRHHDDGQKIAMEQDPSVGAPFAVFQSLVS